MANIDAPFGLRPIAKQGSAPGGTIGTTKYKISSGASALFTGDPVKLKADGSIEVKGGAGAITGAISGVFMGCFYTDPTTQKPTYSNYYPGGIAASDITAFVIDDPKTFRQWPTLQKRRCTATFAARICRRRAPHTQSS